MSRASRVIRENSLRLVKKNTEGYEPFYKTLEAEGSRLGNRKLGFSDFEFNIRNQNGNMLEKYSHVFQSVFSFERFSVETLKIQELINGLKYFTKRLLPAKESGLFFIGEGGAKLNIIDESISESFQKQTLRAFGEGLINWALENNSPNIIPDYGGKEGSKYNLMIFPILENRKRRGFLAVLTSLTKVDNVELESYAVQHLLNIAVGKIDRMIYREKINSIYSELQAYQAKLANDFRLSAVGELTEGIIEDIAAPLQVIISHADLIAEKGSAKNSAESIKEQIKKINFAIGRLVKFLSINEESIKIQPCDINTIIEEFNELVKSSIEQMSFESVLDLEQNIPPVLTHPNYIFQILTNVLGSLKAKANASGGLIFQTRFLNDFIMLKIISTVNIGEYKGVFTDKSIGLNFKIIDSIIKKHEGEFRVDSSEDNGSTIVIKFPLRRKLRK